MHLWFLPLGLKQKNNKTHQYQQSPECPFWLHFFLPIARGYHSARRLSCLHTFVYFYNMDPHTTLILCVLKLCVNAIRLRRLLQLATLCFRVVQGGLWSAGFSASTTLWRSPVWTRRRPLSPSFRFFMATNATVDFATSSVACKISP